MTPRRARVPRFDQDNGPSLEYVAEVLAELSHEADNHGHGSQVGRTCVRAFDVLLWLTRDYVVPLELRRD